MNLLNALVIYFAVGAPFGVLSISRGRPFVLSPGRAFVGVVFWPFAAVSTFIDAAFNFWSGSKEKAVVATPPVCISSSGQDSNRAQLLARRRQQEARVGLESALESARRTKDIEAPFLERVQHPRSDIAAKCFHRRNIARLEKHLERLNS